jgi:hypothetical protein
MKHLLGGHEGFASVALAPSPVTPRVLFYAASPFSLFLFPYPANLLAIAIMTPPFPFFAPSPSLLHFLLCLRFAACDVLLGGLIRSNYN